MEIPPHSERIYLELWPNQAVEILCYSQPQPGEDNSDRIHLIIHEDDNRRGWLMNCEDALAVIRGLTAGIAAAVELGIPWGPE